MHTRTHTCTHVHIQMEGMVTDLQLAREKQSQFEEWMQSRSKQPPVDISVTVSAERVYSETRSHMQVGC